jgi:putative restriction endonuclease
MSQKLSKSDLLYEVTTAIIDSGWNVIHLSDEHPFELNVYRDDRRYLIRVYIWNITHGGGLARPSDEYRIQITSGVHQFERPLGYMTLILGWSEHDGVFAGFDFNKHIGLLGSSPSLQIRGECLRQSVESGFSPCLKENNEIAVAFRPDFLIEYIINLEQIHEFGEIQQEYELLEQAAIDPYAVNDTGLEAVGTERRLVITAVQRRLRSASFRRRVLGAYNYRCAFCGVQLNLVQAAHILPVVHEQSTDETQNGVAACFLHHAAYDQSLITFDERYSIILNEDKVHAFTELSRNGGIQEFRQALRNDILYPEPVPERPNVEFIRQANELRGWHL